MSKFIFSCLAVLFFCLPVQAAEITAHDLTGKDWLQSTQNERLAFIYGVSNVVAIEQLIADKANVKPSIFVISWMGKFKNNDWQSIEQLVTDWYAENPTEAHRGVFDVLWYEFLQK